MLAEKLVEQAHRILKPGGRLFLMPVTAVHRRRNFPALVPRVGGWESSARETDELLTKKGFVNVDIQGLSSPGKFPDLRGRMAYWYTRLHSTTFGRLFPDRCVFHIVRANKL